MVNVDLGQTDLWSLLAKEKLDYFMFSSELNSIYIYISLCLGPCRFAGCFFLCVASFFVGRFLKLQSGFL